MACWDTTVLLDLLGKSGRRRRAGAEARLRQLEHDQPHCVTRFTIAELLVGFQLADDPRQERADAERLLVRLQTLEFDAPAMRLYATIVVQLRRIGRLSGTMDMLIASVALANGHRLVTRNAQHYRDIPGLRVDSY